MKSTVYDLEYHLKFVERANTELGKRIYQARWRLIEKHCYGKFTLLDYGCASGAFHRSGNNGFECYGFDINPSCGFTEMPSEAIDILTLWDVIEHLPAPIWVIKEWKPEFIFIATPNIDAAPNDIKAWKHYRPDEHLYYFNLKGLSAMLMALGYEILEHNFDEGALRDSKCPEAILTVVARRV